MLRFHNVSAYLAEEAPRIPRIDTYLYFIFQAIRCLLSVVRCQVKKDSCKFA